MNVMFKESGVSKSVKKLKNKSVVVMIMSMVMEVPVQAHLIPVTTKVPLMKYRGSEVTMTVPVQARPKPVQIISM